MFLIATRAQNTSPSEEQPCSDGLVRSPAGVFCSQRTTACQSFFSRSSSSSSLRVSLGAVRRMKRTNERRKTDMLLSFESRIHQRESEQDQRNTVALLMEECSEREWL